MHSPVHDFYAMFVCLSRISVRLNQGYDIWRWRRFISRCVTLPNIKAIRCRLGQRFMVFTSHCCLHCVSVVVISYHHKFLHFIWRSERRDGGCRTVWLWVLVSSSADNVCLSTRLQVDVTKNSCCDVTELYLERISALYRQDNRESHPY